VCKWLPASRSWPASRSGTLMTLEARRRRGTQERCENGGKTFRGPVYFGTVCGWTEVQIAGRF